MEAKFEIYDSPLSELKVKSMKAADKISSVENECQAHGSILKGLVNNDKSPRSSTIEWPTLRSSNSDSFQPESVQSHHNTCVRGDSGPRGHSGFRGRGRGRGGATVQGNSIRCHNDSGSASRSVFGGMQRGGGGSPRAASVRGLQQSDIPRQARLSSTGASSSS